MRTGIYAACLLYTSLATDFALSCVAVATSEEWNRVRVGPFGSRDAATATQDKAKSVASCVVIGM